MRHKLTKKAVILEHLKIEGISYFGHILGSHGFSVRVVNVPFDGLDDIDPLYADLLIVMGGSIGAYQEQDYPFVEDELKILKARLKAKKPTMGICLGSQLMAKALGKKVYPGKQGREIGWKPLQATEAARKHSVRHLCGPNSSMFHWHGDTFDLPKGATLLASTDQYENQVYAMGNYAIGLQCHPEVMHDQLEEWFVMGSTSLSGDNPLKSVHEMRRETDEEVGRLNRQSQLFMREWLKEAGLI